MFRAMDALLVGFNLPPGTSVFLQPAAVDALLKKQGIANIMTLVEERAIKDIVEAEDRRVFSELTRTAMDVTKDKLKKLARPALLKKALELVDGVKWEESLRIRCKTQLDQVCHELEQLQARAHDSDADRFKLQEELRKTKRELERSTKIIDKLVGHQ